MYAGRKNYVNPNEHEQVKHNEHLYAQEREPFYKETDGKQDYDVVRFYQKMGKRPRVMIRNRDRRFVENYASKPSSRGDGWFDGFGKSGDY